MDCVTVEMTETRSGFLHVMVHRAVLIRDAVSETLDEFIFHSEHTHGYLMTNNYCDSIKLKCWIK